MTGKGCQWIDSHTHLLRGHLPQSAVQRNRFGRRELRPQPVLWLNSEKPHFGGAFLLRVPDANAAETLDQIRDRDPFTTHKFAQYELLAWDVKTGIEDLDKI